MPNLAVMNRPTLDQVRMQLTKHGFSPNLSHAERVLARGVMDQGGGVRAMAFAVAHARAQAFFHTVKGALPQGTPTPQS